jgi:hypothetical protein
MTTFAPFYPGFYDWLAVTDANNWPDRAGSGMTVSVDNDVMWNGHATLRIDIPALSSGTYRVGTSGATVNLPSQIHSWEGQRWVSVAIRSSNLAAVDNYNLFFGDAGFSSYYTTQFDEDNFPEMLFQNNEWMVKPTQSAFGVGAGSPTFSGAKRLRLNMTVTSDASPTTVWIGGVGFLPQLRPKVIVSLDDGYDEHYSFVRPLATTYGVPVSLSIAKDLIGTAGYMTRANLVEMASDPMVCLVNHGLVNSNYSTLGLTEYMRHINECRSYLQDVGAGAGAGHHAYIQSVWDNALAAAMESAGFLSARAGISTGTRNWNDKLIRLGDKRRWNLTGCEDLETGTSLANVQTQVTDAITAGQTAFIIGHRFDVAAGTDQWAESDFTSLMAWLSGLQKQGLVDCMRWDDWYTSLTQPALVA